MLPSFLSILSSSQREFNVASPRIPFSVKTKVRFCYCHALVQDSELVKDGETVFQWHTVDVRFVEM
jgi:hypothetical protein